MGIDEQLNILDDTQPLHYKIFAGIYVDEMTRLKADGRVPLTVKQIAGKRLESVASENEQAIEGWLLKEPFSTPDAIAFGCDGMKIIPNCEFLTDFKEDYELIAGSLVLTEEEYEQLKGITFNFSKIKTNELLTLREAKEHPVWQALLGDLLEPYTEMVFAEGERRCGSERRGFEKAMGIYHHYDPGAIPHHLETNYKIEAIRAGKKSQGVPLMRDLYFTTLNKRSCLADYIGDYCSGMLGSSYPPSRLVGMNNEKLEKK